MAASKEKVLDVLGEAASKLRGELGESLATAQKFDVPLARASTLRRIGVCEIARAFVESTEESYLAPATVPWLVCAGGLFCSRDFRTMFSINWISSFAPVEECSTSRDFSK